MTRPLRWILTLTLVVPLGIGVLAPERTATAAASASISCAPVRSGTATSTPLESYRPINPQRIVDTRNGTGGPRTRLGAGCTLQLDLTGSVVPQTAQAAGISLTAVALERGYLTVFPCATGKPPTSNVNFRPGVPTPNFVTAGIDANRQVCIYANRPTDVIVDLAGWWSDGPNRFSSIEPVRAYDTRELPGAVRIKAGETRGIKIGGEFVPADATAAVVNLTTVGAIDRGWLTAFPCGFEAPLASNLNFLRDEPRAVGAIVGLGPSGGLCVRARIDVHVIVDVTGYYSPAPKFGPAAELRPEAGTRLVDTRTAAGPWNRPFAAGEIRSLDPLADVPGTDNVTAVLLNVVATNTPDRGFVALFPCGDEVPLVSTLNFYGPESATTNITAVERGENGRICVFAKSPADIVIDRFGTMAPLAGSLAERLSFGPRTGFPTYSPAGSDYAVVCNSGTTRLNVEIVPVVGATARINGRAVTSERTAVDVPADGKLTVKITRGSESNDYFFRCVPPDFPVLQVDRPGDPAPGWYMTTFGMRGPSGAFLAILDERGAPVWYRRADRGSIDFKRLADGRFAYTPVLGQGFGVELDDGYRTTNLAGQSLGHHLTDQNTASGLAPLPVDHHDFVALPGGGSSLLSYPRVENQDLTVLGSGYFANETIVDGVIQEVDANGDEIWWWSTNDAFDYADVTYPVRFGVYPGEPNGGVVDVWHLNSHQRLADGDYVVSARHLDAAFRVDRATGDVLWTLGGAATVPNKLQILNDPLGGPARQHDARLNGDVLTLFDNRKDTGQPARAVAYRIDTSAMTATMLWEIREPAGRSSDGLGSAQVTADGSVLVAWGGLQPMFEEFTVAGERLMAITQAPFGNSYRIVKYPASTFNRSALRAAAGGNVAAPPP